MAQARLRTPALIVVLLLVCGVVAAGIIQQRDAKAPPPGVNSAPQPPRDTVGAPRMNEQEAKATARAAAGQRLGDTVGDVARVHDRPVAASDFHLVDATFAPAAGEVRSTMSRFRLATSPSADLWLFMYRVEGVAMLDWGITDGAVEAQIVIDDATGRATVSIARYYPNAGERRDRLRTARRSKRGA